MLQQELHLMNQLLVKRVKHGKHKLTNNENSRLIDLLLMQMRSRTSPRAASATASAIIPIDRVYSRNRSGLRGGDPFPLPDRPRTW